MNYMDFMLDVNKKSTLQFCGNQLVLKDVVKAKPPIETVAQDRMNKSALPKYRTIKECLAEIKALDKNTAITEWYIRKVCKEGKVKYRASGNKSLVNLDSLLDHLGYGEVQSAY